MKYLKPVLGLVTVLLVVAAVAAPLGPVPGFFIGGNAAAVPSRWPDTSNVDEIMLRVPSSPPRVVIIWVVDIDGELHVVGDPNSGWVRRIGDGSDVHMRLGENTYALRATPVMEDWESILTAYVGKYQEDYPDIVAGFPSLENAEGQFAIFRLDRP